MKPIPLEWTDGTPWGASSAGPPLPPEDLPSFRVLRVADRWEWKMRFTSFAREEVGEDVADSEAQAEADARAWLTARVTAWMSTAEMLVAREVFSPITGNVKGEG